MHRRRVLPLVAALLLLGVSAGCKSPDEINDLRESQAPKTTQEIVIKQELERENHVLTVTGAGKVSVDPDVASVRLSVHEEAETLEEAKRLSNELMATVLTAVKARGVTDANIRTQEIIVTPLESVKNPPEDAGYAASAIISLRIQNVAKTSEIIDAAVQAGANVMPPLEFYLLDETDAYQAALRAAVEDAYAKAALMTQTAGLEIEVLLGMQENYDAAANISNVLAYEDIEAARDATEREEASSTPILTGQLTVRAEVTAEFRVKQLPKQP